MRTLVWLYAVVSKTTEKGMRISESGSGGMRRKYQQGMLAIRSAFEGGVGGRATLEARSRLIDELIEELWADAKVREPLLTEKILLVAVGGYGRRELFPFSDVDLLFLVDASLLERDYRDLIRHTNQELWDCGLRVSPITRTLNECKRFDPKNLEFTLALLDRRLIGGSSDESGPELFQRLSNEILPKLLERESGPIQQGLTELTARRHAKYGGTLFHLEPNVKECPGGLRDVHVCAWMGYLRQWQEQGETAKFGEVETGGREFDEAVEFIQMLRCFLHFRHDRDDNVLDWQAQDAAAAAAIGLEQSGRSAPDPAYWMRLYFRHARSVERRTMQSIGRVRLPLPGKPEKLAGSRGRRKSERLNGLGFKVEQGVVALDQITDVGVAADPLRMDVAHDPEIVLPMFAAMAASGSRLDLETERRLSQALPQLSSHLEEGPALWRHIESILTGHYAGDALRAMHALGILELLIPEFHGIDALVIRDAYHRYTVDEHTFVLIDTLHRLETLDAPSSTGLPSTKGQVNTATPMLEWSALFGQILRDLQQPGLLYLAALLHDTGKGRSSGDHTGESVRLAGSVLDRLELDAYESGLVLSLIGGHLEMSAAMRRDIFDIDTVRAFALKVRVNEALRMLALFTYADINAVHPDALTPWKAENLWRLYVSTANYMDRSVDEERLGSKTEDEAVQRVIASLPDRRAELEAFLDGLPERYLRTRTPEQVRTHFEMSTRLDANPVELDFHYSPGINEMTLVTMDRALLFTNIAGALAAWGMNIVTSDAFSNRQGVVVDTFRFIDAFRTLEMNASERDRFLNSVHEVVSGKLPVDELLKGRRRARVTPPKVRVKPRIDFDDEASSHSTLMQVVAQDTPGLLRALTLTLAVSECNIEVALIDTEGEMAIDVFYLTKERGKLDASASESLSHALLRAIEANEREIVR